MQLRFIINIGALAALLPLPLFNFWVRRFRRQQYCGCLAI